MSTRSTRRRQAQQQAPSDETTLPTLPSLPSLPLAAPPPTSTAPPRLRTAPQRSPSATGSSPLSEVSEQSPPISAAISEEPAALVAPASPIVSNRTTQSTTSLEDQLFPEVAPSAEAVPSKSTPSKRRGPKVVESQDVEPVTTGQESEPAVVESLNSSTGHTQGPQRKRPRLAPPPTTNSPTPLLNSPVTGSNTPVTSAVESPTDKIKDLLKNKKQQQPGSTLKPRDAPNSIPGPQQKRPVVNKVGTDKTPGFRLGGYLSKTKPIKKNPQPPAPLPPATSITTDEKISDPKPIEPEIPYEQKLRNFALQRQREKQARIEAESQSIDLYEQVGWMNRYEDNMRARLNERMAKSYEERDSDGNRVPPLPRMITFGSCFSYWPRQIDEPSQPTTDDDHTEGQE
ncbi:uncharacterized protein JCM15063_006209 [Sporobolomyces koalae]|uniref:uncharacterized protein n=1 Tax=Sporobolomyces koalae TaxID=500713 RepID=UPI00318216A4